MTGTKGIAGGGRNEDGKWDSQVWCGELEEVGMVFFCNISHYVKHKETGSIKEGAQD